MLKNISCHLVSFIVWTYFICHQSILLKCLRMINKVCRLTTSLTCHCLSLKTEVGTTIVPKCINVCIECYLRLHCFPSYVRMVNSIKPFGTLKQNIDMNKTQFYLCSNRCIIWKIDNLVSRFLQLLLEA